MKKSSLLMLCYNLSITKRMIEVNLNKWVELHNYLRAQKETDEKIIEELMLMNKAEYEKSTMGIFELEAIFERLSSEFIFSFPNETWFLFFANKVKDIDLTMSYDDYEKVTSPEELKTVHKKYLKLINLRIDNKINPVIENFIEKLRKHQNALKSNSIVKHLG